MSLTPVQQNIATCAQSLETLVQMLLSLETSGVPHPIIGIVLGVRDAIQQLYTPPFSAATFRKAATDFDDMDLDMTNIRSDRRYARFLRSRVCRDIVEEIFWYAEKILEYWPIMAGLEIHMYQGNIQPRSTN